MSFIKLIISSESASGSIGFTKYAFFLCSRILFIGEILEAIKIYIDKSNKDINLWIVGDGNNKKSYKDLVKKYRITNNVTFLGKKRR